MKKGVRVGYLIILLLLILQTLSYKYVDSNNRVYAAEVGYSDFYEINTLPSSDIILSDTFELITATHGDDIGVNEGPSIHSSKENIAIITQDKEWQFGGLWYKNKINMKKDFSMLMYVYLGNKWGNGNGDGNGGADGITFTIQGHTIKEGVQLNETIGANGAGLGAYRKDHDPYDPYKLYSDMYISSSLVLEFDTFYNNQEMKTNDNGTPNFGSGGANGDKFYGHIDLTKLDDITFYKKHGTYPNNGPYFRSVDNVYNPGDQDLTDNRWRKVKVDWNSTTNTLTYNVAGYDPIVYEFDSEQDIEDTFGGYEVYWGFTGSTGALRNEQKVGIFKLPDQTQKTIEKKVRNITKDGESAGYSPSTVMKVGDTLEYRVTVDYPSATNTQTLHEAYIKDELPPQLSYVPGSLEVKQNSNVLPTPSWNNGKIELGSFDPGNTFVITYQVTVDNLDNGVIINTAGFFSKYTNPISDSATVESGAIEILKFDGGNNPLEGAEFTVTGPNGYSVNLPQTTGNSASSFTLNYLEPGEYTITETKAPDGYLISSDPKMITIAKGDKKTVKFTNYKISELSKQQKNSFEDDTAYADASTTLVGDMVDFKITSILPNDISTYRKYKIVDTLDQRLSFVSNTVQLSTNPVVSLTKGTDYQVSVTDQTVDVALTSAGINKLSGVNELHLIFTAKVNDQALSNLNDIPNKSHIEYINISEEEGIVSSNITKTTPVTGEVNILKVFIDSMSNETPLQGATFILQRNDNGSWENFGSEKESNSSGELSWTGLAKGKYKLIETKAPDGYILLPRPIEFEITSDTTTHEQSFTIENKPKQVLPDTGGIGTTIFTVSGLLLMLSAGTIIVFSRRKKENSFKGNGE